MTTVYREDRATKKVLGNMTEYPVSEWRKRGRGRYTSYIPLAWLVPDEDLPPGHRPMSESEALAIRCRRRAAGVKSAATTRRNLSDFCDANNLTPGIGAAARRGEIDMETARRISAAARDRHENTDYDDLLSKGVDKDAAREMIRE